MAYLRPDTVRTEEVCAGVVYRYLWSRRGPWAVHILEVDLSRCELGFRVRAARADGDGGRPARQPVTGLFRQAGAGAVAAVNGDFFTPEGRPLGTEVTGGVVRSVRGRPAFAWRPGRGPWIGLPSRNGDSILVVGWTLHLGNPDGRTQVIGGFPEILDGGARVGDLGVSARENFAATRHPRTAVGYDPRTRRLWLVVVDGRQDGYSVGMTLPELAGLFEALGASEALNLDGGGSSIMVIHGRAVSRPSDADGERPVANALVVEEDPTLCAAARTP